MQASRHQSPLKYRKSTVMQYAKNFYLSIAYSVIGKPSIWKSYHLDNILQKRNMLFKYKGIRHPLAAEEATVNFKIENFGLNGVELNDEKHFMQVRNYLFEN